MVIGINMNCANNEIFAVAYICGLKLVMMGVIFMIFFGSSKLATGAAHKQLGAAREPSESPSSPGEARKQPRRAQEHPQV